MALCPAKVDVYMVQIIRRWKLDSFMKYIQKEIKEFTSDLLTECYTSSTSTR